MALQCTLHLSFDTIIGCNEIWTDKQQKERRAFKLARNLDIEYVSSKYFSIEPSFDASLPPKRSKMYMEAVECD